MVRVVPGLAPETPTPSVPEIPLPLTTVKFAPATPLTGSLNVTVKTGGSLVVVLFTLTIGFDEARVGLV